MYIIRPKKMLSEEEIKRRMTSRRLDKEFAERKRNDQN